VQDVLPRSITRIFGHHDKAEGEDKLVLVIAVVKESLHDFMCHRPSVALIELKHCSDLSLLLYRYPELSHELALLRTHKMCHKISVA